MIFTKEQILQLYRKRAKHYDLAVLLFRLLGFREGFYRREAVKALNLKKGDTVVEIGCGTGLNFPLLQDAVGPEGNIIAVDLTDTMLDQARARIARENWTNMQLVQSDAAEYRFPSDVNGILSTFAITLVPEHDQIIKHGSKALKPGGRFVILDLKEPPRWPRCLIRFAVWLTQPFGVTIELAERHPWESIGRYLKAITLKEYYFGSIYLSVGEASDSQP